MKTIEEQYEKDFVQYTDKEIMSAKGVLTNEQSKRGQKFNDCYSAYKDWKQLINLWSNFKVQIYNEIFFAFYFKTNFQERLNQELTHFITGFQTLILFQSKISKRKEETATNWSREEDTW